MNMLNRMIHDIQTAVGNPAECPDPLVLAIFRNDLKAALVCLNEYGGSLNDLDQAVRYVGSRVTGNDIQKVLRKWGKI